MSLFSTKAQSVHYPELDGALDQDGYEKQAHEVANTIAQFACQYYLNEMRQENPSGFGKTIDQHLRDAINVSSVGAQAYMTARKIVVAELTVVESIPIPTLQVSVVPD